MGAGAQSASAVCCGHDDLFSRDFFFREFARRISQVERDTSGELCINSQSIALAGEQYVRLFALNLQRFGNLGDRNDRFSAICQRGHHRTRSSQNIEYDARCIAQIAIPQHFELCRRKQNFD